MQTAAAGAGGIPKRYILLAMCFLASFICYIDRVNISVAIVPMAEQYGWSATTQGLVLSSFFLGYLISMAPSGWASNRFGGKALLGVALIGWSLFTVLTPLAAGLSLAALLAVRVVMGLGEASNFPAIYNLLGLWIPPSERSRATAINLSGMSLGTLVALPASGWLVVHFGWPSVFYVFGAAGIVFALFWLRLIHPSPATHPTISPEERRMLEETIATGTQETPPVPWRRLLREPVIWAMTYNHFCGNWSYYLMLAWLPSYFAKAQKLEIASSGLFAMGPWLSYLLAGNLAAYVCDQLIRRGVDRTRVRKAMQVTGLLGSGGFLLAAGSAHTPTMALLILCGALGALAFSWPGLLTAHLDIAPRYAAVLVGISNTAGTIPGVLGVAITGWLFDQTGSYNSIFVLAGAISLSGALVWFIWGNCRQIID